MTDCVEASRLASALDLIRCLGLFVNCFTWGGTIDIDDIGLPGLSVCIIEQDA
jgi:hypothetical protein